MALLSSSSSSASSAEPSDKLAYLRTSVQLPELGKLVRKGEKREREDGVYVRKKKGRKTKKRVYKTFGYPVEPVNNAWPRKWTA